MGGGWWLEERQRLKLRMSDGTEAGFSCMPGGLPAGAPLTSKEGV